VAPVGSLSKLKIAPLIELSVGAAVNVIVFSTSTILSEIPFNCNTKLGISNTFFPSNSNSIEVPFTSF